MAPYCVLAARLRVSAAGRAGPGEAGRGGGVRAATLRDGGPRDRGAAGGSVGPGLRCLRV